MDNKIEKIFKIRRVYDDGSEAEYTLKRDKDTIWFETDSSQNWLTFDVSIADAVIEAIRELK